MKRTITVHEAAQVGAEVGTLSGYQQALEQCAGHLERVADELERRTGTVSVTERLARIVSRGGASGAGQDILRQLGAAFRTQAQAQAAPLTAKRQLLEQLLVSAPPQDKPKQPRARKR